MFEYVLVIFLVLVAPLLVELRDAIPNPPKPGETAKMARFLVYHSAWASVGTLSSSIKSIETYPFTNVESISDGRVGSSTGIIYMYLTSLDFTSKDIAVDNRCTVLVTLAQSDYCDRKGYDPEDPRCARAFFSGKIIKLDNTTAEYETGKQALFARHPGMRHWPASHGFYVAKVDIEKILVLDHFGGAKDVTVENYYQANPLSPSQSSNEVLLM